MNASRRLLCLTAVGRDARSVHQLLLLPQRRVLVAQRLNGFADVHYCEADWKDFVLLE